MYNDLTNYEASFRFGFIFPTYEAFKTLVNPYLYKKIDENFQVVYNKIDARYNNDFFRNKNVKNIIYQVSTYIDKMVNAGFILELTDNPINLNELNKTETKDYNTDNYNINDISLEDQDTLGQEKYLKSGNITITKSAKGMLEFLSTREGRITRINQLIDEMNDLFKSEQADISEVWIPLDEQTDPYTTSELVLYNYNQNLLIQEELDNLDLTGTITQNDLDEAIAAEATLRSDADTLEATLRSEADILETNTRISEDERLTTSFNSALTSESNIRFENDNLLQSNIDLKANQTSLDSEIQTRSENDNILANGLVLQDNRNNAQDLSILENSENIILLNNLISSNLLFAYRLTNGTSTLIGATPVNLPLPNVDVSSIFETLDGGITFTIKPGQTLLANTRLYWEQVYNFTLSNVSNNDSGTLTSFINGTPYTIKEIDLRVGQISGSFLVKNSYLVPSDTTTLSLTTKAQATNGNFNAILLNTSYITINSQNASGSVASTTTNITYDGINSLLVGQNQTQIDDSFRTQIDTNTYDISIKVPLRTNFTNGAYVEYVPFETPDGGIQYFRTGGIDGSLGELFVYENNLTWLQYDAALAEIPYTAPSPQSVMRRDNVEAITNLKSDKETIVYNGTDTNVSLIETLGSQINFISTTYFNQNGTTPNEGDKQIVFTNSFFGNRSYTKIFTGGAWVQQEASVKDNYDVTTKQYVDNLHQSVILFDNPANLSTILNTTMSYESFSSLSLKFKRTDSDTFTQDTVNLNVLVFDGVQEMTFYSGVRVTFSSNKTTITVKDENHVIIKVIGIK